MTATGFDETEDRAAYGQRMYDLGYYNAYLEMSVKLAQGLAEIPQPQSRRVSADVQRVNNPDMLDLPIESLGIQNPTKRILKSYGITTIKELVKHSQGDLMKYKGIAAGRACGIDLLVRKNGITLREP